MFKKLVRARKTITPVAFLPENNLEIETHTQTHKLVSAIELFNVETLICELNVM